MSENASSVTRDGKKSGANGWKERLKDVIVAGSMANWCFVRSWARLVTDKRRFFSDSPVHSVELWALLANVGILTVLIWGGIRLWRRTKNRFGAFILEMLFVALLVIPADFMRTQIFFQTDAQTVVLLKQFPVIILLIVGALLVFWKHRQVAKGAAILMAISSPVAVMTTVKILMTGLHLAAADNYATRVPPPPMMKVKASAPRVVWIIFDETDFRLVFVKRPAGVALPEFDALRQASFFANQAYGPADQTIVSMPSLITGHRLDGVAMDGPDLALTLAGTDTTNDFSAMPTVFSAARNDDVNSALVGWFVPYGRLVGHNVNYCAWRSMPPFTLVGATNFFESMLDEVAAIAWPVRARQIFIDICNSTLNDALSVAGDPRYGLCLFHLPPPHGPGVYLGKNKFTALGIRRPLSYFGNLALADRELGELRRQMEKAGEWDKTWVIISADHSWRTSSSFDGIRDYRVPFIVKAPGAPAPSDYDRPFNTVLTHDLVLAILHGKITNVGTLRQWMNAYISPDLPIMPSHGIFTGNLE